MPLVLAALTACAGCVERLITVTSQPSGSLVYLNDEEVGRTPVTVPFTFYGVYDVRVEHEPVWVSVEEAAGLLWLSQDQVRQRVADGRLDGRVEAGRDEVRIYYRPLWAKQEADAPWWEAPGPDLFAEAVPHNRVELHWQFRLEPIGDVSSEKLIDRARQLRSLLRETAPVIEEPAEEECGF